MKSPRKTNTLAVARFNTADLKSGRFKALMAKPCKSCQDRCRCVPNVWFSNYAGEWELM